MEYLKILITPQSLDYLQRIYTLVTQTIPATVHYYGSLTREIGLHQNVLKLKSIFFILYIKSRKQSNMKKSRNRRENTIRNKTNEEER
jgi:hypothetical protein